MWGFIAAVAIAAIVAAAFLSRQRKTTVGEAEPFAAHVGPELGRFIETVNSINDPQTPAYIEALERMRGAKARVIEEASRLISDESDAPFPVRHSTLLALAALREPTTLSLLARIALNPQPLPPRDSSGQSGVIHDAGALAAGTILALDALDGIEALADDGNKEALNVLVEAVAVPSNAIRATALTALSAKPDRREHFERARATLRPELGYLTQFRRMSVQDVPQVRDPREHLAGPERGGAGAPVPDTEAGRLPKTPLPEHRAPDVRGRR